MKAPTPVFSQSNNPSTSTCSEIHRSLQKSVKSQNSKNSKKSSKSQKVQKAQKPRLSLKLKNREISPHNITSKNEKILKNLVLEKVTSMPNFSSLRAESVSNRGRFVKNLISNDTVLNKPRSISMWGSSKQPQGEKEQENSEGKNKKY